MCVPCVRACVCCVCVGGSFVLMLIRIMSKDLPIFIVIYTIFLFGRVPSHNILININIVIYINSI